MAEVLLFVVAFGTVPTLLYLLTEHGHRHNWAVTEPDVRKLGEGPYRAVPVVARALREDRKAPATVRLAAFTSFALGQMFVPWLIAAIIGLFAYGSGLLAVPVLVVAWRVFAAGLALLRRDPEATALAQRASREALVLHLLVLFVGVPLFALVSGLLAAGAAAYAAVSLAHALLLAHAAEVLTWRNARDADATAALQVARAFP